MNAGMNNLHWAEMTLYVFTQQIFIQHILYVRLHAYKVSLGENNPESMKADETGKKESKMNFAASDTAKL